MTEPDDERSQLLQQSKVFCMAPWVEIHVSPRGEVYPCCASGDVAGGVGSVRRDGSLAQIWNGTRLRELRRNMLAGRRSELCKRCYHYEDLRESSERDWMNEVFALHFERVQRTGEDGSLDVFAPPYLDVRFTNVCNYRCRICLHDLSSAWYADAEALGLLSPGTPPVLNAFEDPDEGWRQVEALIPSVERLHFAGGEPMVTEEHYRILDILLAHGRKEVMLTYNTNFSTLRFKSWDVTAMWQRFDHVVVFASLDGMEERGDYMRKGQRWPQVVENRERILRECPKVDFYINATASIMNVFHLPDFYRDWVEKGLVAPGHFQIYLLLHPDEYNVRGLPPARKQEVRNLYRDFIDGYLPRYGEDGARAASHFESVLSYMDEEQVELGDRLRKKTRQLDALRSERWADVFPELGDLA